MRSPISIAGLNRLPIRQVGGATVYLSDVAHVRDGWAVQQNIVHAEGKRSVLLTIIKNGDASTLDVVNRVKAALPDIQKAAPPGLDIKLMFDQSVFVQNAIDSVLREGAIAAGLTALMILIFLGSWRSTFVVMVSIPLSILTSIAVLAALGETINTMTLGGLALAVGILVDDSTVTIENTHRLLEEDTPFDDAVLEGAAGIAVPTLISTLAICCVFVSVFFLQGAARYLFTPLAMAVVFAMLASYVHFAHADPDHDPAAAAQRKCATTRPQPGRSRGFTPRSTPGSTASATSMPGCSPASCAGGSPPPRSPAQSCSAPAC